MTNDKSKIWSPRFDKPLNEKMKMFNQSILFDYRLAKWDIIASIAHAKMLEKVGLFTNDELKLALDGLEKILKQVEKTSVLEDAIPMKRKRAYYLQVLMGFQEWFIAALK